MALTKNSQQVEGLIYEQLTKVPAETWAYDSSLFFDFVMRRLERPAESDPIGFPIPGLKALTTGGAFRGATAQTIVIEDTGDKAQWNLSEYRAHATVSDRELDLTQTSHSVGSIALVKADEIKSRLNDLLSTDIFGTKSGEKVEGFGDLMSTSSVYGQLDPATYPNWKANVVDTTTTTLVTSTVFNKLIVPLTNGQYAPDILVTRPSVEAKIIGLQSAITGFIEIKDFSSGISVGARKVNLYFGVPIISDRHVAGSDGGTADNDILALNTKFLQFNVLPAKRFLVSKDTLRPQQYAQVYSLDVTCAFSSTGRKYQGTMQAVNPDA